jgi:hypothetical protein
VKLARTSGSSRPYAGSCSTYSAGASDAAGRSALTTEPRIGPAIWIRTTVWLIGPYPRATARSEHGDADNGHRENMETVQEVAHDRFARTERGSHVAQASAATPSITTGSRLCEARLDLSLC